MLGELIFYQVAYRLERGSAAWGFRALFAAPGLIDACEN
jgi:hypothetical protein